MSTAPTGEQQSDAATAGRVVAIVGRPNVGKSALFNRLVGRRQALVEELAGTTRDRLYGDAEWRGERFRVVDTGGLELESAGGYPELVRRQVEQAVEEASLLLFVVDAKTGTTPADEEVAGVLRRAKKPVFLLANKAETQERREAAVQFFELGLGEPMTISALSGDGVAELLDEVLAALPPETGEAPAAVPRLAIVGRPNVGKSMLLNAILGEERVIVSEAPGTTRDAIDTAFEFQGRPIVLVDTAGLRRPGRMERGLEQHASLRAHRALEHADTALVVIDASAGIIAQDLHIAGFALKAKTGLIVVANKWDLIERGSAEEFESQVRQRLHFAPWASFRIVSAKDRTGIEPLLAEALRVCDARQQRIETGPLNALMERWVADRPPPPLGTRLLKLFYVSQPEVAPPTFVFFVNDASLAHFGYQRYLENRLRERFDFRGVALRLVFRSRREER